MEEKFYSVEELCGILKLHPKTIRRFIREGKLKGRKIGRSWMVHQDDFRDYAHGELSGGDPPEVFYSSRENPARIRVSAVIELWEKEPEEASRISNSLMAALNVKDPSWGNSRYDYIYYPETGKARFVLYGTAVFIGEIMRFFQIIQEQGK